MIPYLDRDLIRTFLKAFFGLLLFVQIGYFVTVFLDFASFILDGDDSKFGWLLLYYVCTVPRQAAYTVPIATAVAILFTYTIKSRDNELLAYLCGGVSPLRLSLPLIFMGMFLSVVSFTTLEFLAAPGDLLARRIERINIKGQKESGFVTDKNVFQKGVGSRFYNIRSFDFARQYMQRPNIIELTPDYHQPVWTLIAQSGERVKNGASEQWIFRNAILRTFDDKGELKTYREAGTLLEADLPGKIELELSKFLEDNRRPDEISTSNLLDYIDVAVQQGRPTYLLETYLHFNFVIPMGSFILALLMCGHIVRPSEAGVLVGFGGGLVWIAIYYVALIMGREFSKAGFVPVPICAWVPSLAFGAIALYLISRHRTAS